MLGSLSEADDAVQEAWLRLQRTDASDVDNLGAWLTTVVSRVCLDRLRARRARPEQPVNDETPPEPPATEAGPEHEVTLADSIGSALLVVLERLSPGERVAFVLHDVFAVPFEDVARVLERSPDAARQLASRARRRVQGVAGMVGLQDGRPTAVLAYTVVRDWIVAIDVLADPQRLAALLPS